MGAVDTELVLDGVWAGYGDTTVLEDLSIALGTGGRLGVIGRNGAGKTTTLATIVGLADQTRGQIRFAGLELSRLPPFKRARAGIGYVPQTRDIFS